MVGVFAACGANVPDFSEPVSFESAMYACSFTTLATVAVATGTHTRYYVLNAGRLLPFGTFTLTAVMSFL